MWKWFKEEVLGIKPIFKLKIKTSCFSEVWFCVKFSNNNGWTWEYILKEDWKIPSPCNEWEAVIKYFQADNFGYIKEQFNTYEACVAYNENTFKRINEHNKNEREKYESDINKIKSFNEK